MGLCHDFWFDIRIFLATSFCTVFHALNTVVFGVTLVQQCFGIPMRILTVYISWQDCYIITKPVSSGRFHTNDLRVEVRCSNPRQKYRFKRIISFDYYLSTVLINKN